MEELPDHVVVMKVGPHGGETLTEIIERKTSELLRSRVGIVYWGYGGSVCHPTRQVRPLVELATGRVGVIFIETKSDPGITPRIASHLSENSKDWAPVENGQITSSKWALTLSSLTPTNYRVDLTLYRVAVGGSAGKLLSEYMRGRCDKACVVKSKSEQNTTPVYAEVIATGLLAAPWSVFLKSDPSVLDSIIKGPIRGD